MNPRLYWQIHHLSFLFEKQADENLKNELGIGFAQYKVLEAINQNTLAKQNLIASLLDQTEASISRQIKILSKKGLINVATVMGNKRAKEISLTKVGEETVNFAEDILDVTQVQMLGSLSYKEQVLFQDIFNRMIQNAKNQTLLD